MAALEAAGFAPELASRRRSFEGDGDPDRQAALQAAGEAEADRLAASYRSLAEPRRPRLWFTYHSYYKAPDHLGPAVARALAIPYVVAEPSRAGKRARGPWRIGHETAEAGLDRAAILFAATALDREMLERLRPPGQVIVDLPPFLDASRWPAAPRTGREPGHPARLIAVGMFRPGDKLASYRVLADALARVTQDWRLAIVGDGPARPEIEALFRPFGDRVAIRGEVGDAGALAHLYAEADLLVWPAVNEAYGMALLEAQACGCPVLAGNSGGVRSVVEPGVTGWLAPARDPAAFAAELARLLGEPAELARLGRGAAERVRDRHDLPAAARTLRSALLPLVATEPAPA
ncbi:MAG: glycosyltransferase family 4 protein [Methylobacteriaceae bacterium]|nr:glycosyltransferase family 4 protein [Methylobacteriaceae bacterium]